MPLPWSKETGIEHEPMLLRTLRIKFILMNMLLAAIVLALAFGVICYLDYNTRLNTVYSSLEMVLSDAATPEVPQITSIQQLTNEQGVSISDSGDLKSIGKKTSGIVKLNKPIVGIGEGIAGDGISIGSETAAGAADIAGEADAAVNRSASNAANSDVIGSDVANSDAAANNSNSSDNASAVNTSGVPEPMTSSTTTGSKQSYISSPSSTSHEADSSSYQSVSGRNYSVPMIGAASEIGANTGSVILMALYNVTPDGSYDVISAYTNAAIPDTVVLRSNELAVNSKSYRGLIEEYNLYYERVASPENPEDYLIAYADGSSVSEWSNLVWTLLLVGLIALGALFLINIFFSRWALRPVKASIRQQAQFTADASHELKTPLTVILANMAILKSHVDASVGDELQWIDSTETEAQRMQLLVNDMLALSRPDNQKVRRVTVPVEFSDLVEGEVLQFESVAFELGVDLDGRIEEGIVINGDPERLARMVGTLVDNACKYAAKADERDSDDDNDVDKRDEATDDWISALETEAFGDNISDDSPDVADSDEFLATKFNMPMVRVTLHREAASAIKHDTAVLTVYNNGPIIPPEDLPHIFNRFYRADKARTSSKGGYGLGLAIGQEIVQEHNGHISVSSSAEEGTIFTVVIPIV